MTAETQKIRQKRRKESRPEEILDAALQVFSEDGFSGARLDRIAELAGCTKGTIYVYFPSKEELFKAVVRKLITPRFRAVDRVLLDKDMDAVTRLKTFIAGGYRAILENPADGMGLVRMLIADGPKFPDLVEYYHSEVPRVGHEMIKATIQQGIDRGELRPIDADAAAHVIVGPILGEIMRRLLLAKRLLPMEQVVETHLDMVFNGLLANPRAKNASD